MLATYTSALPSLSKSLQQALMPAPGSLMCDASDTAVNVPLPWLRVEVAAAEIVGYIEVRQTFAAKAAPRAGEAVTIVFGVESGCLGAVDERAIAFITKKEIRRAITRVVIGDWIVILIEPHIVGVSAEVDIQASVTVVVGERGVSESASWRGGEFECVALELEAAIALIDEKQRAAAADDKQILTAPVVEICKQSAGGAVEHANAGLLGDVFKGAVAAIAIEAIGKAGRLAYIEVVKSIVVEVSGGDPIVAVNVDAAGSIKYCAPVVDAAQHLLMEGFAFTECLRGNVNKRRTVKHADGFLDRLPSVGLPSADFVLRPLGVPETDSLFANSFGARGDDVIANLQADGEGSGGRFLNAGDLKFSGLDICVVAKPKAKPPQEGLAPGDHFGCELPLYDRDAIARADRSFFRRNERIGSEGWRERSGQRGVVVDRGFEAVAPFFEDDVNFEGIFFGDIFIGARGDQAQDVCQGRHGAVMRCEARLGKRKSIVGALWGSQKRGCAERR